MPGSAARRRAAIRKGLEGSPEFAQAARQLAVLAVAGQSQALSPRQREDLRRALAIAGDALRWSSAPEGHGNPEVQFDIIVVAEGGIDALEHDLIEERAKKETEMERLVKAAAHARALAEDPKTVYPAEITYSYTVRDPFQRLVTKTATSTVADPAQAIAAAVALEKSVEGRTKLAELMMIDLEERREHLRVVKSGLPDFVASAQDMLGEVLATLS